MRLSEARITIRSPCDSNRLRARSSASRSSQLRSASASLWSAILDNFLRMKRSRMLKVASATQASANRKLAPMAKLLGS